MEGPTIGSSNGLFLAPCKPVVALEVVGSLMVNSGWLEVVALMVAVLDVLVTGVTVVLVAIVGMLLAAKVYSIYPTAFA